jgi:hypothetical protein
MLAKRGITRIRARMRTLGATLHWAKIMSFARASFLPTTAFLGLAGIACGGTPVVANQPPSVDAWLVWSSTDKGTTTQWFDAAGVVRGQTDGLIVARGGQLYRVEQQQVAVPTTSCDEQQVDADTTDDADGTVTHVTLVPLADGVPLEVVTPWQGGGGHQPDEMPDETFHAEYRHAVALTAGLGPYLFVAESTYWYSCGAHGNVVAGAFVFDVERGQMVTLVDEATLEASRQKARAALAEGSDGNDLADPSDPATEIHLAASAPIWTDGLLAMRHLFWIDASYAYSDGEWSSYSRTARVDDPTLPIALAALPPVPPAIAKWLSSHPEPRGISWGNAGKAWSKVLPLPDR